MRDGWRDSDAKTVYMLGEVRLVTGVSPDGRQTTLQPPVTALPRCRDGMRLAVPPEEAVRVVTVLLSDFHEAHHVHEALRVALSQSSAPTLPAALATGIPSSSVFTGERMLRRLLGLRVREAGDTDLAIEHALGTAWSMQRQNDLIQPESKLG